MNVGKYDIKAFAAETKNYNAWEVTLVNGLKILPVPNPAFIQPAVNIQRGTSYDLSQLVSVENGTVSFALDGTPDGYSLSGENNVLNSFRYYPVSFPNVNFSVAKVELNPLARSALIGIL